MTDPYATLTIYRESVQLFSKSEKLPQQSIEIPSHWFGRRSGSYSIVTRTVNVLGTIDIEQYSHERVQYGKCSYNGWVVKVAKVGDNWKAYDYTVVNGCIA